MDPDHILLLAGILGCLLMLALTAAIDVAFTSVSWRHVGSILAERVDRSPLLAQLLQNPYHFKATIMLLNTSATITAAAFTHRLTAGLPLPFQAASLVLLLLTIPVVSAALPKALAVRDPHATICRLAGPLSLLAVLHQPLVALVDWLTRPLTRLVGTEQMTPTPLVFAEELRLLMDAGTEEGAFAGDKRGMLEGVFSFGATVAREVMVPRVDIVALDVTASLADALDAIIQKGHSRIPVYRDTVDTIVGMLYAKDLLAALGHGQQALPLDRLLRPAHFVPETIKVDALLKDLQRSKVQIAVLVDEYGGTAGLVTIEDLIEEIFGDIQDEYDDEAPAIQIVSDTEILVDVRTSIDEINTLTGLKLQTCKADRIGGLVYEELGRVPEVADTVALEGATVTVLEVQGVRPSKLRLTFESPLNLQLDPGPQAQETQPPTEHPLPASLAALLADDGTGNGVAAEPATTTVTDLHELAVLPLEPLKSDNGNGGHPAGQSGERSGSAANGTGNGIVWPNGWRNPGGPASPAATPGRGASSLPRNSSAQQVWGIKR